MRTIVPSKLDISEIRYKRQVARPWRNAALEDWRPRLVSNPDTGLTWYRVPHLCAARVGTARLGQPSGSGCGARGTARVCPGSREAHVADEDAKIPGQLNPWVEKHPKDVPSRYRKSRTSPNRPIPEIKAHDRSVTRRPGKTKGAPSRSAFMNHRLCRDYICNSLWRQSRGSYGK
jgi:hypothetical protein